MTHIFTRASSGYNRSNKFEQDDLHQRSSQSRLHSARLHIFLCSLRLLWVTERWEIYLRCLVNTSGRKNLIFVCTYCRIIALTHMPFPCRSFRCWCGIIVIDHGTFVNFIHREWATCFQKWNRNALDLNIDSSSPLRRSGSYITSGNAAESLAS